MEKINFTIIFLNNFMKNAQEELIAEEIRKKDDNLVLVYYTSISSLTSYSLEMQPFRHIYKLLPENIKIRYVQDSLEKMDSLYEMLKVHGFGYPHDSYMINFKYLILFTDNEFRLEGFQDISFKVARSKAAEFSRQRRDFMSNWCNKLRR